MPLDALKNTPEPGYGRDIDNDANPVTNMPAFLAEMEKIAMDAREALLESQEAAKLYRSFTEKDPEPLQIGDWVMIKETEVGKGKKLDYRQTGPYRIVGNGRHPDTFRIMMERGHEGTWNRVKLHRYYQRVTARRN